MRTFSKLKAFCAYPEVIDTKPSKRRDDAAATGTLFHKYIEEWTRAHADGKTFHCDGAPEPVRTWIAKMRQAWTPPVGLEQEVALGLEDLPFPRHVAVYEKRPHEYEPVDPAKRMLTAGRADLVWVEDRCLYVADIKTGAFYLGPPLRLRQLQAQAFAAFDRAGGCDEFRVGIYYARLGLFDWSEWVGEGTLEWNEAWRECLEAARLPAEPRPGPHCLSCWSKKDCPANPEAEAA